MNGRPFSTFGFMRLVFLILLTAILHVSACAQLDWRNGRYLNLRVGHGACYVGTGGLQIEYGKNLLSGYLSAGYVPDLVPNDSITIDGSVNVAAGMRYHFLSRSDRFRPRIGAQIGWLENYHHPSIGNDAYEPTVYGGLVTFGVEVFSRVLNVEADLSFQPGFLVFNASEHPYFGSQISISAGIGFNLFALKGSQRQFTENRYYQSLDSPCFADFPKPLFPVKGSADYITVWQEVDTAHTLVVSFDPNQITLSPKCVKLDLDSSSTAVQACLVKNFDDKQIIPINGSSILVERLNAVYESVEIFRLKAGKLTYVVSEESAEVKSMRLSLQLTEVRLQNLEDPKNVASAEVLSVHDVKVKVPKAP